MWRINKLKILWHWLWSNIDQSVKQSGAFMSRFQTCWKFIPYCLWCIFARILGIKTKKVSFSPFISVIIMIFFFLYLLFPSISFFFWILFIFNVWYYLHANSVLHTNWSCGLIHRMYHLFFYVSFGSIPYVNAENK